MDGRELEVGVGVKSINIMRTATLGKPFTSLLAQKVTRSGGSCVTVTGYSEGKSMVMEYFCIQISVVKTYVFRASVVHENSARNLDSWHL